MTFRDLSVGIAAGCGTENVSVYDGNDACTTIHYASYSLFSKVKTVDIFIKKSKLQQGVTGLTRFFI